MRSHTRVEPLPQKFRVGNNIIEAMRLDPDDEYSAAKITSWLAGQGFYGWRVVGEGLAVGPGLTPSKEADVVYVAPGDWVVQLPTGEFYGFPEERLLANAELVN